MNVQAKKGILFTVLGIIALVTIITVSANAILQVMWLASQDVVHSIIKLLLVRWLSIPLFATIMTLISFLHLLSASKKERILCIQNFCNFYICPCLWILFTNFTSFIKFCFGWIYRYYWSFNKTRYVFFPFWDSPLKKNITLYHSL